MSKVSKAKDSQGYVKGQDRGMCGNCEHFTCDQEKRRWGHGTIERNLRCSVGGFAVKKTSACNEHKFND